ncbi:MAG: hypothetical protein A3H99_10150 [Gallionellales bacterium RIFCSPLOWO2_02_FULL_59_110]|nr:MAG: hypothetical protein A3H99_10150 [Gallionellales bacterium RIFCSPLOWO2_02_FULL_59_110]OGT04727.1 MAG: hypothetical protein A2Z65_10405 [Gallionellales bacterium RIFCSPLOWO2_02_58_13]
MIARGGHALKPRWEFYTKGNIQERLMMRLLAFTHIGCVMELAVVAGFVRRRNVRFWLARWGEEIIQAYVFSLRAAL